MARTVPAGTAISAAFWEACSRGELVSPRCGSCGDRFFIPEPLCPGCGSDDWSWQPSSGEGVVYSYSVVHRSPGPGFEVPYVLAVVDLDDGWTMLTHLLVEPDRAAIGERVRVRFTPIAGPGSALVPAFEPVAADRGEIEQQSTPVLDGGTGASGT